jgi:hypothetical protein
MFIPDADFFPSRIQKSIGSRIRIRNTGIYIDEYFLFDWCLGVCGWSRPAGPGLQVKYAGLGVLQGIYTFDNGQVSRSFEFGRFEKIRLRLKSGT